MKLKYLLLPAILFSSSLFAAEVTVTMNEALPEGNGKALGTVTVTETAYGLLFTPNLTGLTTGIHGFHLHENPSCAAGQKEGKSVPALAAGGHFDPQKTGVHLGPYSDKGHLGDLPGLVVNADGTANYPVLAPRLKSLTELKQHALMIHAGGDNYADHPMALGGGGARMVCGVIE
ncbi:superoxide dismutase [Cu-Zn] SodC [Yersinia massiliensis]|jgi:Cu-Zn family superoxide dismutase|uniref:Superoxide dismutase [Cu-Zn] n=2 Tax=Yersinia TaxID=629 RepID=A0A2R4NTJ2_9GAMM|nr:MULTISPECIES: superoxide dismutase family protein [Yersinia]HEI6965382.1 superoxide dismutase family protein [Yersinia enterocolitica]ATM84675.1 superoxide dismutase [Cu-Zn] SodC1 [Yersinia frederiksenii]AVX39442.1 superoxide dismutase [Cu-Zn] SodC1 [Yersinia massiliensis]MCB5317615.1 superoxide dismutase family protein [Yersinia massiliensis]MDA5546913.1 superoxide dismutase [Cu-Zn] SodC [Yersinia massiliensis]